jgi:DNA-binding CsgD family transcriptional regulator
MANTNIMGIGAHPDDWDSNDDKAASGWMWTLAKKSGHHGALDKWPLYEQTLAVVVELRVRAKQIAEETGKEVHVIWATIKKRVTQERSEIVEGLFHLSDHHRRKLRQAWAIAAALYPTDREMQEKTAKVFFLNNSDQRTVAAWHADRAEYTQLSLFDEVEDDGDTVLRLELLADPSPAGADPGDRQESFLRAVLEDSDLDERVLDVADMLSYGFKPAEIARELGVSKQTIGRDIELIRKYHQGWLTEGECSGD